MANYNNPNIGTLQQPNMMGQQPQVPIQFPYGNNNMLLSNTNPYNAYMGRPIDSQNLLSNNQFLKCRPVSSKEEARAFQIDLDGSLWVFTDLGNGKIYTKQVNNDGTAAFRTYAFVEDENPYGSNQYVTKEEFNKVIQALMAAMPNNGAQGSASAPAESTNAASIEKATMMKF